MPVTSRAAALRSVIHKKNQDNIAKKNDQTVQPTSVPIFPTTAPIKDNDNDNNSITTLDLSNNDDNKISGGYSNDLMNQPIVKGEITTGTSTRGSKMIFMDGFSYLYMSAGKETTGWRCARRNEN